MKKGFLFFLFTIISLSVSSAETKDLLPLSVSEFEQGYSLSAAGKSTEAIPYFNRALGDSSFIFPEYALLSLGKAQASLGLTKKAFSSFKRIISEFPKSPLLPEARLLAAQSLEKSGSFKEAYIAYSNVDLFHPFSPQAKISREKAKALKKKHKKALPQFKPSAQALFDKAMLFWNQGENDAAIAYFNKLLKDYPRSRLSGKVLLMLGRAELEKQDIDAAISNLENVSRYDESQSGLASYYLAIAQGRKGNYDKAIAILHELQRKYPDSEISDRAIYYIGYYQELQNQIPEALASYWKLIKIYPNSPRASDSIWRIGRIYYWSGDFNHAYQYLGCTVNYPRGTETPRALYFQAKAAERLNKKEEALLIYQKIAKDFDYTYYSYRAREKLRTFGISSSCNSSFSSMDFKSAIGKIRGDEDQSPGEISAIMEIWEDSNSAILESSEDAKGHLRKCKILLSLGMIDYAVDEALSAIGEEEDNALQADLSSMFQRAGNLTTGIRLVERKLKSAVLSGQGDALSTNIWKLAYPRGYFKYVTYQAKDYNLDPYLVLALIREESRFNPHARSRSNARGLMQILPSTGRKIARNLGMIRFRSRRMYDPATNIQLGTDFLSYLVNRFDGNLYLALAGYNGGPNRVSSYLNNWYNGNLKNVDIDEFVESIPLRETRLYVQKVMESYYQYKRIYGQG